MRVFHGFEALPHFTHPAVTVGSYDGVHSGHLKLLRTVTAASPRAGRRKHRASPSSRIPASRSDKADGLRLLTTLDEKICLLERLGIDNLVIIPFDRAFSRLAPDEFVRDCLVGHTGAETLVVGFNHRFGHDKQGSYDYLDSHGFGLRIIEVSECDVDAEKVSSTVIRQLVGEGKMARAARLLAHPYLVIGPGAAQPHPGGGPAETPAPSGRIRCAYQRQAGPAHGRCRSGTDNPRHTARRACPHNILNHAELRLSNKGLVQAYRPDGDLPPLELYLLLRSRAQRTAPLAGHVRIAEVEKRGIMMPILEVQSKYHAPGLLRRTAHRAHHAAGACPRPASTFFYEIYNEKGDLLNTGMTQLGFIHSDTRRPCRVPDWFLQLVDRQVDGGVEAAATPPMILTTERLRSDAMAETLARIPHIRYTTKPAPGFRRRLRLRIK